MTQYKYCLALICSIFVLSATSQNRISGKTLNIETNGTTPYVSIGIGGKQTGTISDSKGNFTLNIGAKASLTDSVTFYHPNYVRTNICYNDLLTNGNRIYLTPKSAPQPKAIEPKNIEQSILGKDRTGVKMLQANFFAINEINDADRLSREMGMIFKLKHNYHLKTAKFYIGKNNYKSVKLRLSFYSVENNFPKDLITDHNIICTIENQYEGWVSVDLKPYDIYLINRKAFAVTFTVLESERAETRNRLSILGSIQPNTLVIRDKAFDTWRSISGQSLAIIFNY